MDRPSKLGPSLGVLASQILGLRFRLFTRRAAGRGLIGRILSWLFAMALAGGMGLGSYLLFAEVEAVRTHPVWQAFSLGLFCFLISLFWILWPVVAAQVDEAYELGRYLHFPVRPARLYGLQTLSGLLEPAVLFFYPALLGAGLGLARGPAPGAFATIALMFAYVLLNVCAGRFLLNLTLNVMRSKRSGEILFGVLLFLLGLAALLPPVDASWLFSKLGLMLGSQNADLSMLANTAKALGATPPGQLARGLSAAAAGMPMVALEAAGQMVFFALLTWAMGLWLLKRFYRGGRGLKLLPAKNKEELKAMATRGWRLPGLSDATTAVFEKELRTFLANPKSRMLFAVPFFLVIILKIVGGQQIFFYIWGPAWSGILWTLLGFYVLSVLAGQFFVNGFGYEGHALRWVWWFPTPLDCWLRGRNLAQAVFSLVQMLGLGLALHLLLPRTSLQLIELPLLSFPFALAVLLGAGNILSLHYPRHFHFSLARRDRPAGPAFMWALGALGMAATATMAVLSLSNGNFWIRLVGLLLLWPIGYLAWRASLPRATKLLHERREALIEAITK